MAIARELEGRLDGAASRLEGIVRRTPQPALERYRLIVKCENRQVTGSFKVRGAANAVRGRREEAGRRGVIAASAGNHGLGVAFAARATGVEATVFVPAGAVRKKVEGIRRLGGSVVEVPGGYAAAEAAAQHAATACGAVWISPYNDLDVIAGQGTVGLELAGDLGRLPGRVDVYVPVGGGGLIAGVASALRHAGVAARVIGVQPEASPFLYVHQTGQHRRDVVEQATIADGLAGDVEEGSVTLELVDEMVDEMRCVSEDEIKAAAGWTIAELGEVIEPSAAAAVAAWRRDRGPGWSAIVLSGGNVDRAGTQDGAGA